MRSRPLPSVRTLAQCFDDPAEARRIFKMSRAELLATDAGAARNRECYHPPKTWDLRMHALNECGRFHGIESLASERQSNGYSADEYADYLNAGDPYLPTVIYWRGRYRVQCVGDFIERSRVNWR